MESEYVVCNHELGVSMICVWMPFIAIDVVFKVMFSACETMHVLMGNEYACYARFLHDVFSGREEFVFAKIALSSRHYPMGKPTFLPSLGLRFGDASCEQRFSKRYILL